jgi:hypothetical protein
MDWCDDATVKETPSHRSQCGGLAVSQNSNTQSSHAHVRCRFRLFILLTINDLASRVPGCPPSPRSQLRPPYIHDGTVDGVFRELAKAFVRADRRPSVKQMQFSL